MAEAGFGIYIHWPYCQAKCPYCDFNSHVADEIDQRQWARAYVAELERYHSEIPQLRVDTVFFGGGTPSLMDPRLIDTILLCIAENWGFSRDAEITLEANPTSVEAGRFGEYAGSGINRVSLGIQSLDDKHLRQLGRLHSAREALAAIEIAQARFARVSIDLIYARQEQSLADWQAELSRALALGTEHLSLYQLTIEPGTAFGRRHAAGRLPGLPGSDLAADMFELTQEMCDSAGRPGYEISNHAAPGAESRHNLIYWRGGSWLGIGPGAHGRLEVGGARLATDTPLAPGDWLKAALGGNGEASREPLSPRERAFEYLMMGLRLHEGVDLSRLSAIDNGLINPNEINNLSDLGLIETDSRGLRATPRGRLLLNRIIATLVSDTDTAS